MKRLADVRRWYKKNTQDAIEQLEKYSLRNAVTYDYFYDQWHSLEEIEAVLPTKPWETDRDFLKKTRDVELKDTAFHYFLHLEEFLNKGEQKPLDFAEEEIKEILINLKRVDFFASVCEWAGIDMPEGLPGCSYKKLVEGCDVNAEHQDFVVTETLFDKGGNTRGWALRTKDFKYVMYDKGRYREQLFDMNADRGEMRNLAVEKKYEAELKRHRALLNDWMNMTWLFLLESCMS